jgi:two-component system KDP operon response regulator KdpE
MPSSHPKVLVVDDEPAMRKVLRTSLAASGYAIQEASSGEEAIERLREQPADLALLDINMPGIGGIEACRRIRNLIPRIGIVMITVRDQEDDKVHALEAGADDYVTKPFRFRELVARMRSVLRRSHNEEAAQSGVLRAGDLELDLGNRVLRKSGGEVHLSPKEFDLLAFLMSHLGMPVTHARLLRAVWGPEYGGELEYLRTYMKLLRKKIELDASQPQFIVTEPWLGYRFRDPSDPDAPATTSQEDEY